MTEFSVLAQWILNQNKNYQQLLLDLEVSISSFRPTNRIVLKSQGLGFSFAQEIKKILSSI